MEDPIEGEEVKVKINSKGLLDKGKTRICVRGDIQSSHLSRTLGLQSPPSDCCIHVSYAEDRQACYHTDGVVLCVGGGCFGLSRFGNCELM